MLRSFGNCIFAQASETSFLFSGKKYLTINLIAKLAFKQKQAWETEGELINHAWLTEGIENVKAAPKTSVKAEVHGS